MAFSHGSNDAQKAMGIITLALVAYIAAGHATRCRRGCCRRSHGVPHLWVILACAAAIGAGDDGGRQAHHQDDGQQDHPHHAAAGLCRRDRRGATILGREVGRAGVDDPLHQRVHHGRGRGQARRGWVLTLSAVRWGVAGNIVRACAAWVLTLPMSAAVQARMKGESKGAVDNSLATAVALADTSKHVWVAGEVPALAAPLLDDTPAKGLRRVAGSFHFGEELEIRIAAAFSDEAAAKAMHDEVAPKLDEAKALAVEQGLPQQAADTLALTLDGAVVEAELTVDLAPLFESSTKAFTGYMDRSKTSEAKVNVSRMLDGASAYLAEERIAPGGGAEVLPHVCPNDGRTEGETGMTPPAAVACAKGPQGRCTPGGTGEGGYDAALWSTSNVWSQLGFQVETPHYFHYNFKWRNDPTGGGACQFTAQAFGDLDDDGVYSTFERAGAADENGVNTAAGLYIDRELE
jgi:hypothetical protein